MKHLSTLSAAFAIAAIGASFLAASCETESAGGGGSLSISPSDTTLAIGQSVTLKARGAETYTWSLEGSNNIGRLSNNTGSTTTYTALSGVGVDQIIRVTATTTTSSGDSTSSYYGSGTNETSRVSTSSASTTAIIRHR